MSDTNSSNSQTPPAPPAPPAGPNLEDLHARMAELEKAREGLIRDVQEERRKRQELETRLTPSAPASSAAKQDEQDELGRVLKPYIEPVRKEAEAARALLLKYDEDKAMEYLASKLGKSKQDVLADQKLQERLLSIQRRWGVRGNSIVDTTTRVYELMELEDMKQKEVDRVRSASAAASGSLPPGTPPAGNPSKQEFSAEDFEKMNMVQYDKLASSGTFAQDASGKIVYTPN